VCAPDDFSASIACSGSLTRTYEVDQFYEFYDIAPGDLADVLGFQNGDILEKVNGHSLVIPADYQAALIDLYNDTSFTARVDRNGPRR
jgi:type II secretory pathway component PulC